MNDALKIVGPACTNNPDSGFIALGFNSVQRLPILPAKRLNLIEQAALARVWTRIVAALEA